jgi:ATP-binding cassette subfamily B (MDR/TAP) protein 1
MAFPDLAKAQAAVQRVFPVVDRAPAIDSSDSGGEAPGAVKGEICLRAVTFRYVSL